jgi:hypothetical protein
MIHVVITAERAQQLEDDGIRRVRPQQGGAAVFLFVGPGTFLAEIAYTGLVPSQIEALEHDSAWDTLTLSVEGETAQDQLRAQQDALLQQRRLAASLGRIQQ